MSKIRKRTLVSDFKSGGLAVGTQDSGTSGLDSGPGQVLCYWEKHFTPSVSPHPGIKTSTGELSEKPGEYPRKKVGVVITY